MGDIPKRKAGQVGLIFTVETGIDLSTASELTLQVKRPDGSEVEWTAAAMAAPNQTKMQYTTVETDLDQLGIHRLQCCAVIGGATRKGDTVLFEIVDDYL